MLTELVQSFLPLPDVWGEGAIFAFSGLDGETCTASGFVASYDMAAYDFLIHTPRRARLQLRLPAAGRVVVAANDVLLVQLGAEELAVTYSAWHTLVGCLPAGVTPRLVPVDPLPGDEPAPQVLRAAAQGPAALALAAGGGRFALAYGTDPAEAQARAAAGLAASLAALLPARLAWLARVAPLDDPAETRFLRKCAAVMKVNLLSPEAAIPLRWSTPDRVPHQHMWLWDTVFHSLAMNWLDPDLSYELLYAMLSQARPDGLLPHMVRVDGSASVITQPPVMSWGFWQNYRASDARQRLPQVLPALEAYLEWNLANRDRNGNGLLEWRIEQNKLSRSGESGLDNSPRFDGALVLDAVDFSTFQAMDMGCLSQICAELGLTEKAARWSERARGLSQTIHRLLWDPTLEFYCDRDMDGRSTGVRAVSGFLPLLLEDIPPAHAAALLRALADPQAFATACPVPSVSRDHAQFSTDMWRGATWVNLNYLIIQGLNARGFPTQAEALAEQTLAFVRRYYERFGVIFEFFDSTDQRTPPECDRKGPRALPYDFRRKYDSIRDYHWSAALCFCLLMERGLPDV